MSDQLAELETRIAGLRAEQVVLVNELDRAQAQQTDASRSLAEFVAARADIGQDLANDLVFAARVIPNHRPVSFKLAREQATFDRTMGLSATHTMAPTQQRSRRATTGISDPCDA